MDDSCSDEEAKIIFMGIEGENPKKESEGVVDLESELISDLEELRKYKKMHNQLKMKVAEVEKKKQ